MGEIVIIKKVCPCCKYEYWTNEQKENEQPKGKKVEKQLRDVNYKGKDDFIPVNVVGEYGNIITIAVECPRCGIHINPNKCTTKEKK